MDSLRSPVRSSALVTVAVALTLLGQGCMLGPHASQIVASRDAPIRFHGFHLYPNREITLQTADAAGAWRAFGAPVRTAGSSSVTFDSYPLYAWSADVRIPADRWTPGYTGYRTVARAVWRPVTGYVAGLREGGMLHVRRDWFECAQEHDTVDAFTSHCSTGNPSAGISIYTQDYCDQFGPRTPELRDSSARLSLTWESETDRIETVAIVVDMADSLNEIPQRRYVSTEGAVDGVPLPPTLDSIPAWRAQELLAERGLDDICEVVDWVRRAPRLTAKVAFANGPTCSPPLLVDVPIDRITWGWGADNVPDVPDCAR